MMKRRTRKNERVTKTRIYESDLLKIKNLLPNMDNADRIRSVYNYSLHNIENILRNFDKRINKNTKKE